MQQVSDLEDVRARLEARGLLRTASQPVQLPDPVMRTIVLPDAGEGIVVAGAPASAVGCPSCRATREVGVNRTSFECRACHERWQWAICAGCDRLALTAERQEAWRCRSCDAANRAWWRTTLPTDEPSRIIRRRAEHAAAASATVVAVERRSTNRRVLVRAALATAVVVALLAGTALLRSAGAADGGRPCAAFESVVGRIQSGSLDGPAARTALHDLAAASDDDANLRAAARAMAAAPSVFSTEFAVARTRFQDACTGP